MTRLCQDKGRGCNREAMVARMPGATSAYHIHYRCFRCAVRYYRGSERAIARTALRCRDSDIEKVRRRLDDLRNRER